MQTTQLQKLLTSLFAIGVTLIALNAWIAFHAEETLAKSEFWVIHTLEMLNGLERSLHESSDAESNARGFLLTQQERYFAAYTEAATELPRQIERLQSMTTGQPEQLLQLQQAEALAGQELSLLQKHLIRIPATGPARQLWLNDLSQALDIILQLNRVINSIETSQRHLLHDRLHDSARARLQAKITIGVASTLDVLFILIAFWTLSHEHRMREEARLVAERLQKLQTISDVAVGQMPLKAMTEEMLKRLRATSEADAVALYTYAGEATAATGTEATVEVVASLGVDLPPGRRFTLLPGGPLDRASSRHQTVRLVGDQVQELPVGEFTRDMGTLLILPLSAQDSIIGLLVAGQHRQGAFSQQDEDLLVLAADRISTNVDRARLFESERQARLTAEQNAEAVQILNNELEQRVRQRTMELESTNRELEAFSYSVSHDLRAPLRSVDGLSLALAEDYGEVLVGDGQHYLKRIRAGVQRMGSLIDALLQLSRITRADIVPETVDLSAIAGAVAEDIVQAYPERDLRFDIEPGLITACDPRLMRVVFENMLGNAAKFTSKVEHARVNFGWSPSRRAFYVRDNGAGFDQQYANKLFVAFQRLHGDKDFQGSGIGLATVARVVRRHHGTLWAEGEVGQGATFWFTLETDAYDDAKTHDSAS